MLTLDLAPAMKRGAVLVRLEATDAGGQLLSTNSYWEAQDDAGYRALTAMAPASPRPRRRRPRAMRLWPASP